MNSKNKMKINRKLLAKNILAFLILLFVVFVFASHSIHAAGETTTDTTKTSTDTTSGWNGVWNTVSGGIGGAIATVVGWIAQIFLAVFGVFLTVLTAILLQVSSYNNIINVSAVTNGWVIVRDLCNMFFILILLIIAFATILRVESYNAKKLLPKLLIMAVLINFSKTICGLMIDASQVIMLTFVNAFAASKGALIDKTQILNIGVISNDALKDTASGSKQIETFNIVISLVLGVIALIVTDIVILVMIAVLVVRIIMLWIYTILSPAAFLLSAFPAGQKYASQWWSEFAKYVTTGPVLAFFLWLALTTATGSAGTLQTGSTGISTSEVCGGLSKFFCSTGFQTYIIVIGFLMGGLMVAQQAGGLMAKVAGKVQGLAQKAAMAPLKLGAAGAGALGSFLIDKTHEKTGVDFNLARVWGGIKEKRAERKKERYASGMKKAEEVMATKGTFRGALAMTGTPGTAWEQVTSKKGLRQRFLGGKRLAARREVLENELPQVKFEAEYSALTAVKKRDKAIELTTRIDDLDDQIDTETNEEKKNALTKERDSEQRKLDFATNNNNMNRAFTDDEKAEYINTAIVKQKEYDKNVPMYDLQARAAEQAAVNEKMAKIRNITDSSELLRILNDAINEKDKAMVKAITKWMTQNYDDNEFLKPLAGDTGFKGLQKLMRAFSGTLSDEEKKADPRLANMDAGLSQQDAFALGSEIAMLNKRQGHHWMATGAYTMENGKWREMNEVEHAAFVATETGKMDARNRARNFNRLDYGHHDITGKFHLDVGGLMILKSFDSPDGQENLKRNIQESVAKHLWSEKDKLQKAVDDGIISPDILKIIEVAAKASISNYKEEFDKYANALK
ncbi:MAG: hypothetical protein WCW77_01400 [Patescibacteria group bacterium]